MDAAGLRRVDVSYQSEHAPSQNRGEDQYDQRHGDLQRAEEAADGDEDRDADPCGRQCAPSRAGVPAPRGGAAAALGSHLLSFCLLQCSNLSAPAIAASVWRVKA